MIVPNDVSTNSSAEVVGGIDGRTFSSYLGGAEVAHLSRLSSCSGNRRVLFVQATNPGAYPPLIHASMLMAEAGWEVTFLSAPIRGNKLALEPHPRIKIHAVRARPSHVMSKSSYAMYAAAAARLALRFLPNVVYASDPLGAGPGFLAARLARAALVYHEHDSPSAWGTASHPRAVAQGSGARGAANRLSKREARSLRAKGIAILW